MNRRRNRFRPHRIYKRGNARFVKKDGIIYEAEATPEGLIRWTVWEEINGERQFAWAGGADTPIVLGLRWAMICRERHIAIEEARPK